MESTPAPVAGGEVSLPSRPGEIHLYGPGHGMPGGVFFGSIDQAGDGRILIGGPFGLTIFEGNRFETLGPERGVSEHVTAAMPDRQGNIWIGTGHRGILRLASRGFESWRRQEGLASDQPAALGEDRDGSPVVMTRRSPLSHSGVGVSLQRWNGNGFEEVDLPWPHLDDPGWGWGSLFTQDDRGRWWIATGQGLLELPSGRLLHAGNGLAGGEVFRLFHDAEGVLWVSTFPEPGTLTRIDPRGGPPKIFTGDEGWPAVTPTAFAEDADGTKWFGLYDRGLVRYRGGKFTLFRDDERLPRGMVGAIIAEAPDDLWVAIDGGGLVRARIAPDDGVAAESWTVDRGLSSNRVLSLVRDGKGRLFVGTDRGVDLLDPSTGRVESFGSDDGLAGTFVNVAWVSRQGDRWFGTRTGLSRYLPGPAGAPPPPTVLIHELLIDGAPAPMPSLGAAGVTGPAIPPGQRRVSIGYSAIGLTAGRSLRFQYRMEGLDDGWSPATDQLTAEYASLAPGRYTFVVRALEGGVAAVGEPATVTLAIPAPLSQRWWFRAILGLAVGLAIYLLYRMRLSRMVALERQRTRIAMDLHDEIGSGLGSIGLLADMAGAGALDQERLAGLTRAIGDTASELGTALGDIVGTLRPGGAMLEAMARQLADRGRRLFPGSGATLTISMPASWPSRPLSLALCRSLFLIGVEALHNAARHAGAEAVSLELAREGRRWRLTVRDDGRGLPGESPPRDDGGSGLIGMRRRAAEIGAELRIRSAPGGGTEITVIFDPSTGSSAPEPEWQVI
jgi:signal transduction histidine kinase/sugar lactone lactonase YvrE